MKWLILAYDVCTFYSDVCTECPLYDFSTAHKTPVLSLSDSHYFNLISSSHLTELHLASLWAYHGPYPDPSWPGGAYWYVSYISIYFRPQYCTQDPCPYWSDSHNCVILPAHCIKMRSRDTPDCMLELGWCADTYMVVCTIWISSFLVSLQMQTHTACCDHIYGKAYGWVVGWEQQDELPDGSNRWWIWE